MYRHRVSLACFLSQCYTCIKTCGESDILRSTVLEKLGVMLLIWKICSLIYILSWINHSCIVIHKLLVLDGSLHYVQFVPYAAILQIFILFSMICYYRIQRMPWPNNTMYDDAISADRFRYQLTMFGIRLLIGLSRFLHTYIAYEIDTAKSIAAFFRIFYCFALFDTL